MLGSSEIVTDAEEYSTLQDAFDAHAISTALAPSWLPTGYKLDYVEANPLIGQIIFSAAYSNGQKTISLDYSYWTEDEFTPAIFEKDSRSVIEYTKNGIIYYIMSNENILTAAWINGTCECLISGKLNEKEMKAIIDSIYI